MKKATRSETNLTSLSRVNSRHSNSSNSRNNSRHSSRANSPNRPAATGRQRSDTSVHSVQLDEAGNPTAEVDSGEEGWEDEAKRSRQETPKAAEGPDLRRTKSDPHPDRSAGGSDDGSSSSRLPHPVTRKTTGFAGPTQTPDPLITTYSHALNDPTHIMPAHQIKHQQSARSLHASQGHPQTPALEHGIERTPSMGRRSDVARRSMPGMSRSSSHVSVRRTESPGVLAEVKRVESGLSMTKTAGETPPATRPPDSATESSVSSADQTDTGATRMDDDESKRLSTSPSYPFPRLASEITAEPLSASPATITHISPPQQTNDQARSRQVSAVSSQAPRTLRHRYSNSSIRSVQSLRAPPHPLNSPTGYRTGIHPAGSTQTSPRRSKGPSMHHPPIAPPVISSDMANGHRWISNNLPEEADAFPQRQAQNGGSGGKNGGGAPIGRTSSFSSIRSIATLLGNTSLGSTTASPQSNSSATQAHSRPHPSRRPTAFEATSKASRLRSTADPAAYHASLGLPPATADTAHLISRFLPPPKAPRPEWEISPAEAHAGHVGIGLTNGDYREAHEALVRTMITMGVEKANVATGTSRAASYIGSNGAITPRQPAMSISSIDEVVGVGMVKGSKGGLMVSRGGWEGRSPFLLSVDRCLAQKPVRGIPGI